MLKHPPKEALHHNIDLTFHGMCTHISKDLSQFINEQILTQIEDWPGLVIRDIEVLMCLAYFREPISPSEIAEALRFDRATVTRATHQLEKRAMLERLPNMRDSRSSLLLLTQKGEALALRVQTETSKVLENAEPYLTTALTLEEKDELLRLLYKMRSRAKELVSLSEVDKPAKQLVNII